MYNDIMIYEIKNNIIYVYDKSQFNPQHILECGQVFRFQKDENQNYCVISKDQKATIIEIETAFEIHSTNPSYFVDYFDLNTDYNKIKQSLKSNKTISPMIDFGYGIRILKQDPLEMIFSYIISQNNHISRIQKIIERLCEIGTQKQGFNAFPTLEQLKAQPLEFYQSLGAGYRDKFLKETANFLTYQHIESALNLDTDNLLKWLNSLKGIGPKVASCISLFGFSRKNKFPVDTWNEQSYYNHFSKEKRSRPQIQEYFENEFKDNSGIAQQYIFYFEREQKNKSK